MSEAGERSRRQLGDATSAGLVQGLSQHVVAARVPARFLLVPADLGPLADGFGQRDAGSLAGLTVVGVLGCGQALRGGRHAPIGEAS